MFTRQLSVLGMSAIGIVAVVAQDCEPWRQTGLEPSYPDEDYIPLCLKPDETAEASVDLKSLFPDGLKMKYGIQTFTTDEILDLATEELISGEYDNLVSAGIWFEYSKSNYKASNERATQFDLDFLEGLNGTTEGGNGGCDGVFGKECADGFLTALQEQLWESTYPKGRKPTKQIELSQAFRSVDSTYLSCSDAFWEASFYQPESKDTLAVSMHHLSFRLML